MSSNPNNWILGDKFVRRMPHHDGIKALWETKWKFPCTKSVYPFHDGKLEDFEPVFENLIANNINDGYGEAYTQAFFPVAERLTTQGDEAFTMNNKALSSELFLRAACIYRIARFPYITSVPRVNSGIKWKAWEAQKVVYMKAATNWKEPIKGIKIPFTGRQGIERDEIPAYLRLPKTASQGQKSPAVLLLTGLDGYRPDNTERTDEFLARGWGSVVVEVPGTADSPADPGDPASPDRLWTSVLDWMVASGHFDMTKILVWGLSTGGYYAVRIAHTHGDQLKGVVAQGAGLHYFFDRDWIEKSDGHEYPFALLPAISLKYGYASQEEYKEGAQKKFSLLDNGILNKSSTKLLLVNGTHDGLMPIEDSILLSKQGPPYEERYFSEALHMGYLGANAAVYPWMEGVMAE